MGDVVASAEEPGAATQLVLEPRAAEPVVRCDTAVHSIVVGYASLRISHDLGTGRVGGIRVTYPKARHVVKGHENTRRTMAVGAGRRGQSAVARAARSYLPTHGWAVGARVCAITTSGPKRSVTVGATGPQAWMQAHARRSKPIKNHRLSPPLIAQTSASHLLTPALPDTSPQGGQTPRSHVALHALPYISPARPNALAQLALMSLAPALTPQRLPLTTSPATVTFCGAFRPGLMPQAPGNTLGKVFVCQTSS
jgi:hypothetical protein